MSLMNRTQQQAERERFSFLANRDGLEQALTFVQRTYKQYRKAIFNEADFVSGNNYRPLYIQACQELRKILNEQGNPHVNRV